MPAVRLNYIIYILLIVSPIYLDSPLALVLGAAGNSPVFALCFLLLAYLVLNTKKIEVPELANKIIKLSFYVLIVGFIVNVAYMYSTGDHMFASYSILNKNFFVFLQILSYPIYLILICYFGKSLDYKRIFLPIVVTFVLLALFCVVEFTQLPNAFGFLHFRQPCPYHRVRLLTQESSWTASIILNFFVLSLYYAIFFPNKRKLLLLVIPSSLILFFLSSSKNLLTASGIFIVLSIFFFLQNLKKSDVLKFGVIIVVFIFSAQWLYTRLSVLLLGDIENYTSTATRSYSLVSGLYVSFKYPFGVGGGLWQKYFIDAMKDNLVFVKDLFPTFNYSEVIYYCSHLSKEATAKSGIVQHSMYWGVAGTIYFVIALSKFYKKIKTSNISGKKIILPALLANFCLICFNTDITYDMLMLIGVVLLLYRKNRELESQCIA